MVAQFVQSTTKLLFNIQLNRVYISQKDWQKVSSPGRGQLTTCPSAGCLSPWGLVKAVFLFHDLYMRLSSSKVVSMSCHFHMRPQSDLLDIIRTCKTEKHKTGGRAHSCWASTAILISLGWPILHLFLIHRFYARHFQNLIFQGFVKFSYFWSEINKSPF